MLAFSMRAILGSGLMAYETYPMLIISGIVGAFAFALWSITQPLTE